MKPRILNAAVALGALVLLAAGCAPEPAPSSSVTAAMPTATSSSTAPAPEASRTAAGDGMALPETCEQIYSPAMLQSLQAEGPLNDPGVTMYATQVVPALEILESGIPTLRCTWGVPSEKGMATQVSLISAAQSDTIRQALVESGFTCEQLDGGTVCSFQRDSVNMDDQPTTLGEVQYLRDGTWITTSWIDAAPDGYTQDIVATLWP